MLSDETQPYLWDDASINRYLNNAVREACIRARLLKDDADSQPSFCTIAVIAGQARYSYIPEILVIRSGAIIGGNLPKLWALTAESMDRQEPGWDTNQNASSMSPRYMVMDLTQKSFRLSPTPTVNASLRLRVWRMPLSSELMTGDDIAPVIQIPDPEELLHWAAYEAYLKKDSETFDATRAAQHLAMFEQRFGSRPSLEDMARWADSPPRVRHARMF
jgi:hypothetical protein